ncbi:MAG: hypothetical protein QOK40_3668 [Miltoncostaeaceae bacterium]|nr:hypothetical protein [Miltoncostaeaceae bacterium]
MTATPRLSVVIVTYRTGAGLLPTLDALAAQREDGDEVLVVDNASADGTSALAAAHPAVDRVIETGDNLGFAAACNRGARAARADVLLFLNPDCVPEPGCLAALRRPPAGWDAWMGLVTLADGARVNTAGGVAHYLGFAWAGRHGQPSGSVGPQPAPVGFLSGACLAVRREAFAELGGFAERFFMYGEDVDLSHRLRLAGRAFGLLPAARVRHDYEFHKGGEKWRLLERNRWLLVLRTYPAPLLALVLPALVAAEPAVLAYAAASGWGRQKLRALAGVARALPRTLAERRRIQAGARVGAAEFAAALRPELDSPFLGAAGRTRALGLVLRCYWALVRAALSRASRQSAR